MPGKAACGFAAGHGAPGARWGIWSGRCSKVVHTVGAAGVGAWTAAGAALPASHAHKRGEKTATRQEGENLDLLRLVLSSRRGTQTPFPPWGGPLEVAHINP